MFQGCLIALSREHTEKYNIIHYNNIIMCQNMLHQFSQCPLVHTDMSENANKMLSLPVYPLPMSSKSLDKNSSVWMKGQKVKKMHFQDKCGCGLNVTCTVYGYVSSAQTNNTIFKNSLVAILKYSIFINLTSCDIKIK